MAGTISRLTENIARDAKDNLVNSVVDYFTGEDGTTTNVLHKYRTFSYNVTFAVVSPDEFRTSSYKKKGFDFIIFKSSGKPPAGGVTTARGGNETLKKIQDMISVLSGGSSTGYDFFLQDLTIRSVMTPGKDYATSIRMRILEPYSHDNLMTSILAGLRYKGYQTQSRNNCFVLKIDFVGTRDDREEPEVIPNSTRYYPMLMQDLKANVTQEGTVYEIAGVPINDSGRFNDVNSIADTFSLRGETVEEIMKDFTTKLNQVSQKKAKDANKKPHIYEIKFALGTDHISTAKMYDPRSDRNLKSEAFADKSRYTMGEINQRIKAASGEPNKLEFIVPGANGISNCIDALILDSKYVIEQIEQNFQNKLDDKKRLKWWRVITQVEIVDFDPNTNTEVRKITYLIVPRGVLASRLSSALLPGEQSNAADFDRTTVRAYEWLFTGNNRDILSFKWNYDFLFQRSLLQGFGRTVLPQNQNQTTTSESSKELGITEPGTGGEEGDVASRSDASTADSSNSSSGRRSASQSAESDPVRSLAYDLAQLFNYPYEQIKLDLEILGDPMWLGTQFIDNSVGVTDGLFASDGGIAYRTTDCVIKVVAKGPSDFNQDGLLAITNGQDSDISSFSAYYQVIAVDSTFSQGVFKQKLTGNRLPKVEMDGTTYSYAGFGVKL